MKCILFGGSGEVGGAVARELIASDVCSHLTMLGLRVVPAMQGQAKAEQIVLLRPLLVEPPHQPRRVR